VFILLKEKNDCNQLALQPDKDGHYCRRYSISKYSFELSLRQMQNCMRIHCLPAADNIIAINNNSTHMEAVPETKVEEVDLPFPFDSCSCEIAFLLHLASIAQTGF
jgi:hypothetical protein